MADIASESQLAKLLAAGDNFDRWLVYLKSVRPKYVGTPMLAKIDAAIASGEAKKSTLTKTLTAARDGWKWLKSEGAGAWDWLKSQTGMGFLPAIPLGYWVAGISLTAIIGAEAVLNNWVNQEAATTKAQLDQFDKNVAIQLQAGVPGDVAIKNASGAATAQDATSAAAGGSMFDKIMAKGGTVLLWVGIGFVGWKIAERKGWI